MKYRLPTKAIITDAGCASRFLPLTKTIPKAMLPLGNKPIMQLVVEECITAGIEEIIIVATTKGRPLYDDYFHDPATAISDLMIRQGKEDRFAPVAEVLNFPKSLLLSKTPVCPMATARQSHRHATLLKTMKPLWLRIQMMWCLVIPILKL